MGTLINICLAQHGCRRPPVRPDNTITVMSRSWAASVAASKLASLPDTDSASSTSPAWPKFRTWRANCWEDMSDPLLEAVNGVLSAVEKRHRPQAQAGRAQTRHTKTRQTAALRQQRGRCRRPALCHRWSHRPGWHGRQRRWVGSRLAPLEYFRSALSMKCCWMRCSSARAR